MKAQKTHTGSMVINETVKVDFYSWPAKGLGKYNQPVNYTEREGVLHVNGEAVCCVSYYYGVRCDEQYRNDMIKIASQFIN